MEHKGLYDGSDLLDWPSVLLWDACALAALAPVFIFEVTVLASVSSLPRKL